MGKPEPDAFDQNFKKEVPAIIAEFLFILLPLLVIAIVRLSESSPMTIIFAPEWAFGAAVLYGQTVVKFVMGFASREHIYHWQNIGLITALLLVLGLVPSLIVLSLLLRQSEPAMWLGVFQISLFIFGTFAFILLGTLGQMLTATSFQQRIAKILGLIDKK